MAGMKGQHSKLFVFVTALLVLGWATPALQAQLTTTQTIEGLVTDATGAVIPGANVTMTNVDTGVTSSVQTNETGNYRFSYVPVGNYDVTCELDGFKTNAARGIRVETSPPRYGGTSPWKSAMSPRRLRSRPAPSRSTPKTRRSPRRSTIAVSHSFRLTAVTLCSWPYWFPACSSDSARG